MVDLLSRYEMHKKTVLCSRLQCEDIKVKEKTRHVNRKGERHGKRFALRIGFGI
jgi:hypothetical protein